MINIIPRPTRPGTHMPSPTRWHTFSSWPTRLGDCHNSVTDGAGNIQSRPTRFDSFRSWWTRPNIHTSHLIMNSVIDEAGDLSWLMRRDTCLFVIDEVKYHLFAYLTINFVADEAKSLLPKTNEALDLLYGYSCHHLYTWRIFIQITRRL